MNIHTPERQPGESQQDYRDRQRASRNVAVTFAEREIGPSGAWERTGRAITLRGLGDQRKLPSSREQHRKAVRDRLHQEALARQKHARTVARSLTL